MLKDMVKSFRKIYAGILFLPIILLSCAEDINSLQFLENVKAPSNVSAVFDITQDNSGRVSITPVGEGVAHFEVLPGDATSTPRTVRPGESWTHVYREGQFGVKIKAVGPTGLATETTQNLRVSFRAPENLVVTIQKDPVQTKTVFVTARADFATSFEVLFGDDPAARPQVANIGATVPHTYTQDGTYTIQVTAKSGGAASTVYTEQVTVVGRTLPNNAAPIAVARNASDVISIYGQQYTTLSGVNYYPNWGQSTTFGTFRIGNEEMIQYGNLNYQGIDFNQTIDASGMQFMHLDVWTTDVKALEIFPISRATGERFVLRNLTPNAWNSITIPLSEFTSQGLSMADLFQIKLVGSPFAPAGFGTIFVDNIYFFRNPPVGTVTVLQNFEGTTPTFTVFGNIAMTEVIANPDKSGENTTAQVAKLTKSAGSETWAGTFFELRNPINLTANPRITMNSWSPKTGRVVKMKLENQDASVTHEVDVTTTKANGWETLTYDFSQAPRANYVRIVVFYDFGTPGDGSVYYFDEIKN